MSVQTSLKTGSFNLVAAIIAGALSGGHAASAGFDVASVKLSKAPDAAVFVAGGMVDSGNGRFRVPSVGGNVNIGNWTLGTLIVAAWDLGPGQLSGPAWLSSERYDIAAKTASQATQPELRIMLQTLLAQRFRLTTHSETKELPVYALVRSKSGSKLRASSGEQQSPVLFAPPSRLIGKGSTMQGLANAIGRPAGRTVVDKTGLTGRFDFSLFWSPDNNVRPQEGDGGPGDIGPSIFTALQEQLGLMLEPDKSKLEILVVDHVERIPTPN